MDPDINAPRTNEWQVHWGRLLRTARQVAGLSLSELSATTGLSKGYLSKLESGHATALNPSRATLAALARALPSFRALAHTLGPVEEMGALALGRAVPRLPEVVVDERGAARESPVRLGWRELEALVAVMVLEQAAITQPITALSLARALGRSTTETRAACDDLARMGVLDERPPVRLGGQPTYARGADFEARVGLQRVGDAFVLAAALLAQAPTLQRRARASRDEQFADE
ncbi:MAG TPA: helix-turn-helix transcriptional regulator [Ktedonobacterales bacterium]|nr:helix-turn-helix transcriptional regulator [Ktedonobacterales bacterium]